MQQPDTRDAEGLGGPVTGVAVKRGAHFWAGRVLTPRAAATSARSATPRRNGCVSRCSRAYSPQPASS